jgi:hypothetical protein
VARSLEEGSSAKMYRLYRFRVSRKTISIALLSFAGLLSFGAIYRISSSSQDFQLRHDGTYSKLHADLPTSINHDFDRQKVSVGVSVNI